MNKAKMKTSKESDGTFFLKLVLYTVMGSQWLWLVGDNGSHLPLPLGLALGLFFAGHEHFKIDRKIEFAVLLVAALIAYWGQVGIYITI